MSDDDVLRGPTERVGTIIGGKYRIDGVLGVGGMAVVYAATHRNRKRFAIKVLHAELSARREIRARFLREGYVANSVNHPGVVAVLDDDVDADGSAFLVMELLEGATVDALRSCLGGRLPVREALAIAHQMLDVLAVAHESSIIHRDIKPANLFVSTAGQVKVLDFGIARLRDVAAGVQSTRAGAVIGTPSFMAPEQALAQGDEIDPRTDVWAAGATVFTMLSGHFVHEGDNARQLMIRAATMPARSLADVTQDIPPAVVELVAQALQFEKAARWASAGAMRDAVARIHGELFGALTHDHLRACLEHAPGEFESAPTEPPLGEASGVLPTKRVVKIKGAAGTMPESPFTGRHAPQSDVATTTARPVSNRKSERSPVRRRTAVVAFVAAAAGLGAVGLVARSTRDSSQDRAASVAQNRLPPGESTGPPLAPVRPSTVATEVAPTFPSSEPSAGGVTARPAPTLVAPTARTTPRPIFVVPAAFARPGVPAPISTKADATPSASSAEARQRNPLEIQLQ